MVEIARHVVMVCDSSKFGRRSLCLIVAPSLIDEVITDSGIGKNELRALEKVGIKVSVV
jgi:DeoR family transcriptional regulator of aga operon